MSMTLRNQAERELCQMEESYLSQLDPSLLRTGEAVARLAIALANMHAGESDTPDVNGEVPHAWALLRRACLEIDTTGRKQTIEDYKRFRVRPPQELLEALKPPPPEPLRVSFDKLFNKEAKPIELHGPNEEGKPDSFWWKQLKPDTSNPSGERKSQAYENAWTVINQRVRQRCNKVIEQHNLIEELCHGRDWRFDLSFATKVHDNGYFEMAITHAELALYEAAANELPRPHNASVWIHPLKFGRDASPKPEILCRTDKSLPGPPSSAEANAEELYEQLKTWAGAVLDLWIKKVVKATFDPFWQEAKERGFLWEDVLAMARLTKRNQGGIKWVSATKAGDGHKSGG